MSHRDPDGGRLRGELRDYYGTAMFNGFPMAMMELEEVERASYEELREMAPRAGITPAPRPAASDWSPRGSGAGSFGVSVSSRTEYISAETSGFFGGGATSSASGFFGRYGRALRDAATADSETDNWDNDPRRFF